MGVSVLDLQRDVILNTVANTAPSEWKVLVLDEKSRKLIDNVAREDDILNSKITNIEEIEQRRPLNKDMDAIYILSPEAHIVDCLMADFERRRYRRTYLYWTAILPPQLRERIDRSQMAREQIATFRVMNIEYYPRESHLITLRDPWSFPVLFHPACSNLVRHHMSDLAQRIVAVCVSLGEYPTIRYYNPRSPLATHESHILSRLLAEAVHKEIDTNAHFNHDFPPQSNKRPPGALYIVDRSMDLYAPFVHEFTYQAMAHDLLPVRDGDKVTYRTIVNEGRPDQEEKDVEIGEKDRLWVENRHRHMKDTIEKLMGDFQKFIDDNPHFADQAAASNNANNLNVIKDMLADLPKFQEMKEAYSLHLSMAQDCMNAFQKNKLGDLASLEQTLTTGLDEEYRRPKNLADQLVRMLDEDSITHPDRLRLIAMYLLYRDGLLQSDITKLRCHANLPPQDEEVLRNLELLGARYSKPLKDIKPPREPLFPIKVPQGQSQGQDEYALSRFEPAIQTMLQEHVRGTLDTTIFPFTKMDPSAANAVADPSASISSESLRTAKPTWAKSKATSSNDPRQRIIVFVAGGATYSESRACYQVSAATNRDIILVTSHMLSPGLWMRQLGDLSADRRKLGIPADQPAKRAPAHLFEKDEPPKPPPSNPLSMPQGAMAGMARTPAPPTAAMGAMRLNGGPTGAPAGQSTPQGPIKLGSSGDKNKKDKPEKEKKKHHFFSSKK